MIGAAQSTGAALSKPTTAGRDPESIKKAAQDFEALLIAGILKMVRESSSLEKSGMGEGDQAGATALEMAEEQMSRSLAQSGGLGLAALLANGLSPMGKPEATVRAEGPVGKLQDQREPRSTP